MIAIASVLLIAQPAAADEIRGREYWLSDYNIQRAWQTTRGAGVTIAVIDTGIDGAHQDLTGTVIGGTDVSGVGSSDGQTPVGDDSSHGTLVASLLAGHGHGPGNSAGVIGVAPDAKLLAVSVGFGGTGTRSSDDQIADAVRWATDNGADVINMSLTRNTLEWPESWDAAFLYAISIGVDFHFGHALGWSGKHLHTTAPRMQGDALSRASIAANFSACPSYVSDMTAF